MDFTTFFTPQALASYAGCSAATLVLVQLTKELPFVKDFPTQLYSWFLASVLLIVGNLFLGDLTPSVAVMSVLNGGLVSLAANGGFEALGGKEKR